jgi:hypothetical protein
MTRDTGWRRTGSHLKGPGSSLSSWHYFPLSVPAGIDGGIETLTALAGQHESAQGTVAPLPEHNARASR